MALKPNPINAAAADRLAPFLKQAFAEPMRLPLIFDSSQDVWEQVEDTGEGSTVAFMALKSIFGLSVIDPEYPEDSFPIECADYLFTSSGWSVIPKPSRYELITVALAPPLI